MDELIKDVEQAFGKVQLNSITFTTTVTSEDDVDEIRSMIDAKGFDIIEEYYNGDEQCEWPTDGGFVIYTVKCSLITGNVLVN